MNHKFTVFRYIIYGILLGTIFTLLGGLIFKAAVKLIYKKPHGPCLSSHRVNFELNGAACSIRLHKQRLSVRSIRTDVGLFLGFVENKTPNRLPFE